MMGTPTVVGEHVGPGGRRRGQNNRHMGGCPYGVSRVVEGGAATFDLDRIIITLAGAQRRPDSDGKARGATSQGLGAATRRHTRDCQ
jgi:hypothetical protein